MAGMLACRGWEEVAQSGDGELVTTPSKGDSFPPGLCLGVSDSMTEFYFWQLLSASSRPPFLALSIPGVADTSKLGDPEPRRIFTHTFQI